VNATLSVFSTLIILSAVSVSAAQGHGEKPKAAASRFAELKGTSAKKEKELLDKFAVALSKAPDQVGYIVLYAGRIVCPGEVQARGERMKRYLVEQGRIEPERVTWLSGGYLGTPYALLEMQARGADFAYAVTQSRVDAIRCPPKTRR
jgi:ribosomal protein S18